MAPPLRLYTLDPGTPFLEALVDALLDGRLVPGFEPRGDPFALASATLFLPTRRSIRMLRQVFLERAGGRAALLPRLLALGEIDEDEHAFEASPGAEFLPDAVGPVHRQLGLTRLVLAWSEGIKRALLPLEDDDEPLLIPSSPGDAAALASELGRFIDGMEIERVPFERLAALKELHGERYDKYWDLTLRFLEIAIKAWPSHLQALGKMDPALRRNRLIEIEANRLQSRPSGGPVIVAGSTGSIPATRDLILAVARHPDGAVILPGLDLELDALGWNAVGESQGAPAHPQAGLKALLEALGADRDDVKRLGDPAPSLRARERLLSEALRPADTTDQWAAASPRPAQPGSLAGVALVEAAHEGEEALAVALALREALERPGQSAALVTPDRGLAARVTAELDRWAVAVNDSAGQGLLDTPSGIAARLVLDAALANFAAVPVLALLQHPFTALGLARTDVRQAAACLDIGALRGPQPPPGIAGLRKALANGRTQARSPHAHPSRKALGEDQWQAAAVLLDALETALRPLCDLLQGHQPVDAARLFTLHREAVEAALSLDELYAGEAGQALLGFFDELRQADAQALAIRPGDYPGLFASLAKERRVRGGEPKHPRIAIYGLLEARLLPIDRIVLGGLDEGAWPGHASADPWLNRPMRAAVGLSSPEKRLGLAAHDFVQGFGAREVILTRSLKRGGTPTVPARWLQRIKALAEPEYLQALQRGQAWRDLARGLDAPRGPVRAPAAPRPRPPRALRPSRLSVTRIEDLIRDPYSIYARAILKLEPLEPVACPPGAADRGTLIHEAIRRFADLCEGGVPADAEARLLAIGRELFESYADYPDVTAFWWPRFRLIATFLADWESKRREGLREGLNVKTEIGGEIRWQTAAQRTFVLSARADRIEIDQDGAARIVDFKTGAAPSTRQIVSGLSPQLILEAAILLHHGFPDVAFRCVADPLIVSLGGGAQGCREQLIVSKGETAGEIAARSLAGLKTLIDRFEDETTPYAAMLHPMFKSRRYGAYDHLARVREWSLAGEEEGGE